MFYTYFLLFIIYSIIGWILEIGLALVTEKRFSNRGFLIGPYCPIYGCGCILISLFLKKYENDILVLFILSMIICALLEYFTSFLMEKIFKMRWWDYSNMKFNINGRICLETMVPFGLICVLVIKYLNPFFISLIEKMSNTATSIVVYTILVVFLTDNFVSYNIISKIKKVTKNVKKDSTEEIKKTVHQEIHNHIYVYDRIIKAFPTMSRIIKVQKEKTKDFIDKHKKNKKN